MVEREGLGEAARESHTAKEDALPRHASSCSHPVSPMVAKIVKTGIPAQDLLLEQKRIALTDVVEALEMHPKLRAPTRAWLDELIFHEETETEVSCCGMFAAAPLNVGHIEEDFVFSFLASRSRLTMRDLGLTQALNTWWCYCGVFYTTRGELLPEHRGCEAAGGVAEKTGSIFGKADRSELHSEVESWDGLAEEGNGWGTTRTVTRLPGQWLLGLDKWAKSVANFLLVNLVRVGNRTIVEPKPWQTEPILQC
eukprot:6032266-Amphidinium_carterae.2